MQVNFTITAQEKTWEELMTEAESFLDRKEYALSIKCLEVSLIAAKKEFGVDHENYALSCFALGTTCVMQGDYEKAEPWLLEASRIWLKISGKFSEDYLQSVKFLTTFYQRTQNYSSVEKLYVETIEILSALVGKVHPDYLDALVNLGIHYTSRGYYAKAKDVFLEALEIEKKIEGADHPNYALLIDFLGEVYRNTANYNEAERMYLEAKSIRERALGKNDPQYARSLNNLAVLYSNIGDYPRAESLYLETKDRIEKQLGKDNFEYALAVANLGEYYRTMGNYTKAELLCIEAVEIRGKVLGKQHPQYALSLGTLALLYDNKEDYYKATPLYQEALQIQEKVLGKDHPEYALTLNNLAEHYRNAGDYSQAQPMYLEALKIWEKSWGMEHPAYAAALNNLALVYERTGDYAKAEALLVDAMDLKLKLMGKENPAYVYSLNNLGSFYYNHGNPGKAETLFLESISLRQNEISRYFPTLSEKEKRDYYFSNKTFLQNFEIFSVDRYVQNPRILGELYNLRLATKGLLFQTANKIRDRILSSNNPDLINKFDQWKSKKDFLAKVYQLSLSDKQQRGIDEKQLEEEISLLEKELSVKSELFANQAVKKYTWENVRLKLKKGEAAIEVIRTYKKINDRHQSIYAALIVTPETHDNPEIVILQKAYDLEIKFLKYYRNAIKQQLKDEVSYDQFWKPIAEKIHGVKKIYLSADGVYNQINPGTLLNPSTGKFVIDEVEIQMVTSTKQLAASTASVNVPIKNVTLFGYPNYNGAADASQSAASPITPTEINDIRKDSLQRFFDGENISELPGTQRELEMIESQLRNKKIPVSKHSFNSASEGEIKKLNSPQVLHIATHGFFLSDLSAQNPGERGFAGMETSTISANPLLRSGLVFASAANTFKSGYVGSTTGEDGILTAYEAMSLNLDKTDLVVLSACETGLGVTTNGEGVYGLQRAFQVAGAKAVLMSLWTVSDDATQQLMTLFYQYWLSGKSAPDAFRSAQLSLRNNYPEPFFWGAFIMVGY